MTPYQVSVPLVSLWPTPAEGGPDDMLTQLLLGDRVLVEEIRDGWARGVAADQPAGRLDERGYPGWLPAAALTPEESTVDGPGYVVDTLSTDLYSGPDGSVTLGGVPLGTRLTAAGPAARGWLPVRVSGHDRPLWTVSSAVASAPAGRPDPVTVLAFAGRLLGVPYVWGGLSPAGLDCSGLVHLSWRRYGVTVPRDASDQHRVAVPVPLGEERPGDLYFFARDGASAHHVGFVAAAPGAERQMLHAPARGGHVVAEPVRGERAATLIGAGRVGFA